jgi:hypothetical protein
MRLTVHQRRKRRAVWGHSGTSRSLRPFAVEKNDVVLNIAGANFQLLGNPRAGVVEECEQDEVALTGPRVLVGGSEDGVDLLSRHEAEGGTGGFFERDREDALARSEEVQSSGAEHVAHEGAVAASRTLRVRGELRRVRSR